MQALGASLCRRAIALFNFTPNPWSGWAYGSQLLDFWQLSIAIYICALVVYIRVRASLYNHCGCHPVCHVLFKLVVHAFCIVCMLTAMRVSTRQRCRCCGRGPCETLWCCDKAYFLLDASIPYAAIVQRPVLMSFCKCCTCSLPPAVHLH